jgi:hypothetical protein
VPPQDHKPDEFGNVAGRDQSSREPGEFTRAFGGRADQAKQGDPSGDDGPTPAPGSLTQLLGGKSKKPSPPPMDKLDQPPLEAPNPPESRPSSSFTSAFDGVNAFTRDPADLAEYNFQPEAGKRSRPDLTQSASPASFTRLFGSGEGALTPAGEEGVEEERPRPRMASDREPLHGGSPGFPHSASVPDRNDPPSPPEAEPGSFTEAFRSQSAPESPERKVQRGSFTDQFPPPSRARETELPYTNARTYPSSPEGALPEYNVEPVRPSNPQRTPTPAGGFERLINPSIDSLRPESTLPTDVTMPSMRTARIPDRPLPEPNYSSRGPSSGDAATVIFNPKRQPEPETTEPRGKSEYTMVVERSKLRPPVEVPGTGGSPHGGGVSAAPPSPPQYPPVAPPVPPTWAPTPAPAPPWQLPHMTPSPVPHAPALASPSLPMPPTLGEKLVSFLPFMLALTVINFLGLLAVLIILFATRK